MATFTGKDAKATFGTTTISDLTEYNLSIEAPLLGEPVFGTSWHTVAGPGVKAGTGSLSGLTNSADSTGQVVLENAVISGTKITDLRLYISTSEYWTPDTVTDTTAGVYFSNYNTTAGANDIVKFSCDMSFHGPICRKS